MSSIKPSRRELAPLLLLPLLAPGAGAGRSDAECAEPLRVVCTLAVLADLAATVGGEHIEATSLVDPRQDPHYVSPTPVLMRRARAADLFVEVGLQLELWAEKVASGSGNPRIQMAQPGRLVASRGVPTLELPQVLSREWGDVHPYGNPHVWLDPLHTKVVAANLAEALSALDPAHAEDFARNLEHFEHEIDRRLFGSALVEEVGGKKLSRLAKSGRLHEYLESRDLQESLGGWMRRALPLRGRPVVTYHKTFVYLAKRFGFDVPIEIEEKPGIPPSARHRERVLETMQSAGVRTILQEVFYERSAAEWLAERTGAHVAVVPIDVGTEVGARGYFDLIDRILGALVEAEEAAGG